MDVPAGLASQGWRREHDLSRSVRGRGGWWTPSPASPSSASVPMCESASTRENRGVGG
jgi:hypothetical protein